MEESKEETFDNEIKMGEVAPRNPVLKVSVSFGRFEGDSLSWEKWSSFSPNKYLEEVEKCATPGSVAEKKAYFEEHYKKIAARIAAKKAELLDQGDLVESKSFKSDDLDRDGGDSTGESSCQCSVEDVKEESKLNGEVNGVHNDVSNEEAEAVAVLECRSLSVEGEMEKHECRMANAKLCEAEEAVLEKACDSSLEKEEMSHDLEKDEDKEETQKIREENKKLDHQSKSNKNTTAVKKGADTKMISASFAPQSSTPRTSTSAATTTTIVPSSRTSTKGGAVSSLTRTKNRSMQESKKMASKSLHMSLNLDSFGSNSAPPATTKKSLITTSTKGGAVSSSTRTKNPSMRESKKLAPKSLHMSLNLDPGSNSAPLVTTSKPLVTTSTKGGAVSSSTRTRNPSKQERKKVAPKTLHKSLNLDPPGSVSAPLATTRKSPVITSAKGGTDSSATRTKVPSMQESKKVAPKSLHMSLNLEPSGSNSTPLTATTKSHGITSTRGGTFSSPTRTKNPSMRESKKATPKSSLHMSLNLEPSGPNSAPPTTANISITITSTMKGAVITSSTRTEDHSMRGSKKVDSNSLHISLNLDPSESKDSNPPPLTTTRKSLVMEKMGDKDIVKRAFKTFQNKNNQLESSSEEQSTSPKQVAVKGTEPEVSTTKTPRKENGGSVRTGRMEKRTDKNAPPQSGLKNDDSAEKRKEISKKLEEISHSRETARTRLQTKSKEDKEAEIRKLSETFTFKARPMPAFYRGQKLSKSYIDKDTKKNGAQ